MTASPPECSEAPRAAHTGWREPALTQSGKGQTGERARPRLEGRQDSILPQPRAQVLCTPSSLTEKQLPRLLREPKGRKPALPGQTGDDIVASLSCKFLNTTSCQGPLPTAPGLHADDLEPGWECQAWAPPPAQPRPAVPARRSAWPTQESRCLAFQLAESILPPGNISRGSLTHSAITLLSRAGSILEERVEDVFQPREALAVPAMPQRWVGYLHSYSSTNTTTPAQHVPPKPALQPPSHTSSPWLHNSLRAP